MTERDCYSPDRDGAAETPPADTGDSATERPRGDPWHAFGYLTSGVFVYGLIGWGLDRWLGTDFLVAVGILVGAGFGIYMTWARFRQPTTDQKT